MGNSKINWQLFPKHLPCPVLLRQTVAVFESHFAELKSIEHEGMTSNEALAVVTKGLVGLGFDVETGKDKASKISIPVLYGPNGKIEKSFDADAFHKGEGIVLEVEAGRAVVNYQFLKDLFQACMMQGVDFLVIAARNDYRGSSDFEKISTFMNTLYASERIVLPLKGILIVGY